MIYYDTRKFKLKKANNAHNGPHYVTGRKGKKIAYFKTQQVKWEQYMFCRKDLYDVLGPLKDWEVSHGPNIHYSSVAKNKNIKRVYAGITPCMWFHDNLRERHVSKIQKGLKSDPNFILFKMHLQKDVIGSGRDGVLRPMTTEDYKLYNV